MLVIAESDDDKCRHDTTDAKVVMVSRESSCLESGLEWNLVWSLGSGVWSGLVWYSGLVWSGMESSLV